jgi:hypothetical protein
VLGAGFRPPVAAGFSRFLVADRVAAAIDAHARKPDEADPYDTHPPLHERVAALAGLPRGDGSDARPAIELLDGVDALERELLTPLLRDGKLTAIAWDTVGTEVYVPTWRDAAERHALVLADVTADALLDRALALVGRLGEALPNDGASATPQDRSAYGRWVLAAVLAAGLVRAGWRVRTLPGDPITLEGPAGALDPFATIEDLVGGKVDQAGWRARCAALGLVGLSLTPAA